MDKCVALISLSLSPLKPFFLSLPPFLYFLPHSSRHPSPFRFFSYSPFSPSFVLSLIFLCFSPYHPPNHPSLLLFPFLPFIYNLLITFYLFFCFFSLFLPLVVFSFLLLNSLSSFMSVSPPLYKFSLLLPSLFILYINYLSQHTVLSSSSHLFIYTFIFYHTSA